MLKEICSQWEWVSEDLKQSCRHYLRRKLSPFKGGLRDPRKKQIHSGTTGAVDRLSEGLEGKDAEMSQGHARRYLAGAGSPKDCLSTGSTLRTTAEKPQGSLLGDPAHWVRIVVRKGNKAWRSASSLLLSVLQNMLHLSSTVRAQKMWREQEASASLLFGAGLEFASLCKHCGCWELVESPSWPQMLCNQKMLSFFVPSQS